MVKPKPMAMASLLIYAVWYLLPQFEWRWLSEDAMVIISYSGFDSTLGLSIWLAWSAFAVVVAAHLGVIRYGSRFRIPFLLTIGLFVVVIAPLSGIVVETGLSIAIRDLSNIVIGVLLFLLFTSREKFYDTHSSGAELADEQ